VELWEGPREFDHVYLAESQVRGLESRGLARYTGSASSRRREENEIGDQGLKKIIKSLQTQDESKSSRVVKRVQ